MIPIPGAEPLRRARNPALGYLMALAAAALFGVNGTVVKVALDDGLSAYRLAELRCLASFVIFVAIVAATRPERLRTSRRELAYLAVFGACAVVLTQLLYLLAIRRLKIGVALVLIFLGPLLVALWARFVYRHHVRRRIWVALGLALVGLGLIVNLFGGGGKLSTAGVLFALGGAVAYMTYVLLAEHAVGDRDPVSLLGWGFLFASLFWAVLSPWWTFPAHVVFRSTSLGGHLASSHLPVWALAAWMIVLGTIIPFFLLVSALRHISATSAGIVAMLEPVAGALLAWAWLGESLDGVQLAGAAVVLGAIVLAQTAR